MAERPRPSRFLYSTPVFFLFSLLTPLVLYWVRHLDDNRLTSWNDIFAAAGPGRLIIFLAAGNLVALVLARSPFYERRPGLFLFSVSFAVGVIFWQEPEVIFDASRYFIQAKHLEVGGVGYFLSEWGKGIEAWTDMPVVPFLYGLIFRSFGEHREFLQAANTLFYALTVVLTYLLGKRLWDGGTGFYGGLFLLGVPYLFSQVPLTLVDVPLMFFLMLSAYVFLLGVERGGLMIPVASAVLVLTVFVKYSAVFFLSACGVIFVVLALRDPGKAFPRCLAIAAGAVLPISALAYCGREVFSEQVGLLLSFQGPGLRRWGESLVSTFFFQVHPWLTCAALWSVYLAFRKRDLNYLIVLWLPLLVLLFQIRRIRYLLPAIPMICLAASYGLGHLRHAVTRRFIALAPVASSVVLAVFFYLPFLGGLSYANLKEAGAYLDSLGVPEVEVFVISPDDAVLNPAVAVPVLDIYTGRNMRFSYDPGAIRPPDDYLTSPLRFTWDYGNPAFYREGGPVKGGAVAVIAGGKSARLPEQVVRRVKDFEKVKTFTHSDNIFAHQTFVTLWHD